MAGTARLFPWRGPAERSHELSAVFNNVLPVFLLVAMGRVLLHFGMVNPAFFKVSDRLVYFIFFPALLFLKIAAAAGHQADAGQLSILHLMPWVLGAIVATWGISLLYARLTGMDPFRAGTFSQVSYRFNTYVGMAVVLTAWGEPAGAMLGALVGLAIPTINLLAVGTLVWYSQEEFSGLQKLTMLLKALVANPLIIACAAGMAYAAYCPPLPVFAKNALGLMSSVTLPMALMSVGAGLSLSRLRESWRPAAVASLIKLVVLPAVGILALSLAGASGLAFKVAAVYFVLPSSPSAHILASQLGSDAEFAVGAVALTMLLSFFSLSIALMLLH